MITQITHITVLVYDQDEALRFYTQKLGFEKRSDDTMENGFRWLTVAPKGQESPEFVLVKANPNPKQEKVGRQAADYVLFVVRTENCQQAYETLRSRGVKFLSPPAERPWGTEAIFEDLYSNRFDLLEPQRD